MAGRIIYSYPVSPGHPGRLRKAPQGRRAQSPHAPLCPARRTDRRSRSSLDEVRRLGEQDADFRRSIVTSTETLNTIVDASIRELDRLRTDRRQQRLKIIASALNFEHCRQIVEAYRARGRRADYVHSREDSAANERVMQGWKTTSSM